MGRLDNKVALVTGAAGGVGSAVVSRFLAAGARVLAADQAAVPGAVNRASDAEPSAAADGDLRHLSLDITDETQWQAAAELVRADYGGLDILVNCAAFLQPGMSIESTTLETWRKTFAVNAEGSFLACQFAIPLMRGRPGASIVMVASGVAIRASVKAPAYGASKAAVIALTKSVALHCAQQDYGIRANVILPGALDTPMLRRNIVHSGLSEHEYLERIRKTHPLGRIGLPEDIAAAALFLAGADSSFMTGTEFIVDGGQTL